MVKFKGKISHCYHILASINDVIFKELNNFWDCKFIPNEKIDCFRLHVKIFTLYFQLLQISLLKIHFI